MWTNFWIFSTLHKKICFQACVWVWSLKTKNSSFDETKSAKYFQIFNIILVLYLAQKWSKLWNSYHTCIIHIFKICKHFNYFRQLFIEFYNVCMVIGNRLFVKIRWKYHALNQKHIIISSFHVCIKYSELFTKMFNFLLYKTIKNLKFSVL